MPKILITDDDAVSRTLLKEILSKDQPDYEFIFAANGSETLETAAARQPDIVLLDLIMPQRDGFETLHILKSDRKLRHMPVIMITAVDDVQQKINCFKGGAADFIVKPFNGYETRARVATHLTIKRNQDELRALNSAIISAQDAMIENSKMAAVGNLAAGIAHEFNNICFIMKGHLDLYTKSSDPQEQEKIALVFKKLIKRASLVVDSLLHLSRSDENKLETDLEALLLENMKLMERTFRESGISVSLQCVKSPAVMCYPLRISQVFINLLRNALEAMQERDKKELVIKLYPCALRVSLCKPDDSQNRSDSDACVAVSFADTGGGVPADVRKNLFAPFVTTKGILGGGNSLTPGKGLGLFIAYNIVNQHGGRILLDANENAGSIFTVVLPVKGSGPDAGICGGSARLMAASEGSANG